MNITLKSVPKKLHIRLKESANRNGRSLNTEAIAALKHIYLPIKLDVQKHLQLIRATRQRHPISRPFTAKELKAAMAKGRE
jgi:hypothetical protein